MIEYDNIVVDFKKGYILNMPEKLVQNDYNSTKLNFIFNTEGSKLFKMLYPDAEKIIVKEITDNSITLSKGDLSQEGIYQIELTCIGEDSRLTNTAISRIEVRRELVSTDEVVENDDRIPVLDDLINRVNSAINNSGESNITDVGYRDITSSVVWESGYMWHRDVEKQEQAQGLICNYPVKPGEKYRLTGYSAYYLRFYILKSTLDEGESIEMFPEYNTILADTTLFENLEITIPENCNYMCISQWTGVPIDWLASFKLEKYEAYIKDEYLNSINVNGQIYKPTNGTVTMPNYPDTSLIKNNTKNIEDRIIDEQNKNSFCWKKFDKVYLTMTFDDTLSDIDIIENLAEELEIPFCYAAIPDRLDAICSTTNEKVREVLDRAVSHGGEVLSHWGSYLTSESKDEDYYNVFIKSKELLTEAGYEINGFITPGGTDYQTQDFEKGTKIARIYYKYADRVSENDESIQQFHNFRKFLDSGVDDLKSYIDTIVANGSGWINLGSHGTRDTSIDDIKTILQYALDKGCIVVTWKYLYEKFKSSIFEEKFNKNSFSICFDNVASMKSANLKVGDYVITKGYYTVNDGGGAEYIIRAKATDDVDDGGSVHIINNSLVAELIIKDSTINIKQFGAKGDSATDDSNAFVNFLNSDIKQCFIPDGTYNINVNLNIKGKNIFGSKESIISTETQSVEREHQIHIAGSNIIKNVVFKQNCDVALCGFFSANNCLLDNCSFIVNHHKTNGYVDLYTNNQNIYFNNCNFDCYSIYNDTLQIGGVWVREVNSDYVTENVFFNNCIFTHTSVDECIAVWHWLGTVENTIIDNCIFIAGDNCTAPHFIGLGGNNCQLNNSIVKCNSNTMSCLKGDGNKVNNCKIYANSELINGISSGSLIFTNCTIENEFNNASYLSVDSVNKYYNCIFNFVNIHNTRNIELYGCEINTSGSMDVNMFTGTTVIMNTVINVNKITFFYYAYSGYNNASLTFVNSRLNVSNSINSFATCANNSTTELNIQNSYIRGNITTYGSGGVFKGKIINNYINGSISKYDELIVKNNIYNNGTTDDEDNVSSTSITSISVVDELPVTEEDNVLYLVKESTTSTTSSTTNTVQASEVVNTPASTETTVDNAEVTDTPTSTTPTETTDTTDTTETEV